MSLWSALLARRTQPAADRPSLTLYFLLTGAFLLTLVPHAVQFPPWLSVALIAALILRSVIEVYRFPLPSTTFCGILALLLLGAILLQFHTVAGREAGTAFTAGLLTIKFYEMRRPRDVSLIIFSCFFMVMSALLYSQVLELFVYCLIMMWVLTALLLRVHTGDLPHDRLLRMLWKSGIIFVQALPLALVLFFFCPRYSGQFRLSLNEAPLGLTDTVAPGSIAKLARNDAEAMYVQFVSGSVPLVETMYWRALVLWDYKDGIWTPGDFAGAPKAVIPAPDPNDVKQEITIRPHHQRWLFALDVPVSAPVNTSEPFTWARLLYGNVVQLQMGKLDHATRYEVTSSPTAADRELNMTEAKIGTRLPLEQIDPRVKALAEQLHQGVSPGQEQEYVRAVLHYFRHGGFIYSATPGEQGPDWLPTFLFETKTGFCEHFASAFAILMRLEKVPARLVVGYQGADYNPYSNHYIVSQSNAHAWDEIWLASKNRWVRVDPTAILGSAEEGLADTTTADPGDTLSSQVGHRQATFLETYFPPWVGQDLKQMQLRREQVEADWDNLVFSYDPETQSQLAQALGLGEQARLALLFICLVAAGICLIFFRRWMERQPRVSPVENLYAAFCRTMARRGISRAAWEGPLAYTERVAEAFPEDKAAIQRVGILVAQVRYGPAPADPAAPHALKSLLTLLTASRAASVSP